MFFTYSQNNSGGVYDLRPGVSRFVIVEADTPAEADAEAERHGVYFNGVHEGHDCGCCGDRWTTTWEDDPGSKHPEIYGEPALDYEFHGEEGDVYCIIYYANGVVQYCKKEEVVV